MNFHKNLQMLRKERKISQEKLAEKLNVSRQAVSKWENQEAYPEMDKIIAICKIFNCSMDELLNANMESERKNKSTFINYFEELLKYFASIIKKITHMSFKDILKMIIGIIILIIILVFIKAPLDYITTKFINQLYFLPDSVYNIVSGTLRLLITIAYIICSIIIFIYIIKIKYLDKEYSNKEIVIKEEKIKEEKEEIKKEIINNVNKKDSFGFIKAILKIIMIFLKIFIAITIIPFIFALIFSAFILTIDFALLFKGVILIGSFIILIATIPLLIIIIMTLLSFIFNRKTNLKRIFIIFITTIFFEGIGIGITTIELSHYHIQDVDTKNYEMLTKKEKIAYNENLILLDDYNINITYIKDNSLNDILIELPSYKGYISTYSYKEDTFIRFYTEENKNYNIKLNDFIQGLKNKEIRNYHNLYNIEVKIYSNENNINKLKQNHDNYYKGTYNNDLDICYQELNYTENALEEVQDEKEDLTANYEEQITNLQDKIKELEDEINDYKENLKNLLEN